MAQRLRRAEARGDWFAPSRPRILAHRGLALEAPENTIASFDAAIRQGAVYIETDVHSSKDGVAMVAHDSSLKRVAGIDREVSELTMSELQSVDLGGGHHMPTLADALVAFPTIRFNIDVKSESAAPAVAAAVLEAHATDRVLITSFSWRRRAAAVDLLPGVASSASAPRFVTILILAKLGLLSLVPWAVGGIDAVQVPTRLGRISVVTPKVVRALHRLGIEMHIWTINEPTEMERLLDLAVDGIVTDRVDLALALLQKSDRSGTKKPPH